MMITRWIGFASNGRHGAEAYLKTPTDPASDWVSRRGAAGGVVRWLACLVWAAVMGIVGLESAVGQELKKQESPLTADEVFRWTADDPEQDAWWEFKNPESWRFAEVDGQRVLSQFKKASRYQPPHRSPLHMALIRDKKWESFQLDCWVKSTHPEYGHRDVCFFFNYQGPDRFYYLHLASEMDDRANQLFIVNQADRAKISTRTTPGTKWDDQWHHVRIVRRLPSGQIQVFFDDMEQAVITAEDDTFGAGQIGLGTFDDTADFRKIEIRPLAEETSGDQ